MSNPDIVAELRRIAIANGGKLKASDVVEAARPAASVLHSRFEWDDSEAAQSWRLHQARNLISVTVEYLGDGKKSPLARVFVSLTPDRKGNSGGYRAMDLVLSSPKHKAQLLKDALEEMRQFQEKYAALKELARVFEAMRSVRRGSRKAA